jgi:hypothetical protein
MRKISFGLAFLAVLVGAAPAARAGEFTDVIDAFDQRYNGDPFDLNLSVGYERLYKQGDIRRESFTVTPHRWDYYGYVDVAKFEQTTHILNLQLDIGIFHDISLRTTLPLILNDTRKLMTKGSFAWDDYNGDGAADTLFSTDFQSPERSGVDTINVGLWWGILDQGRDDTKPYWTIYAEGRFSIGDEMHAACKSTNNTSCAGLAYADGTEYATKSGVGRGVHEIAGGFRLSRRYGFMEPYFGLEALIGFPTGGDDFYIQNDSLGMLNNRPPAVGTIDIGLEFVPWEVKEKERRLVIGIGTGGKYHSEGRDRTPLYDALGTSAYFNDQAFVDLDGDGEDNGSQEEDAVGKGVWTGATDVENYATIFGKVFIAIQPAKYVKFRIGSNFSHETEHFITKTDQCPSDQVIANGGCQVYNWGYRPELDTPGFRFRAEKTFVWDFFLDASAQF